MLMVLELFHVFHERVPAIIKLDPHHVRIKIIIINPIRVVRKAYAGIVIDDVVKCESNGPLCRASASYLHQSNKWGALPVGPTNMWGLIEGVKSGLRGK